MNSRLGRAIRWLIPVVLLAAFPAVGMFVLPAALLWVLGGFRTLDWLTRGIYCLFFGLACWTFIPWLTRYIPVSLSSLILVVVIALAAAVAVAIPRAVRGTNSHKHQESLPTLKWLATIALLSMIASARLLPTVIPNVPPGPDMTMHAYNARLIIDNDSMPDSHRPLLPIDSFAEYPMGFSLLVACTSLMSGMEVENSALLWVGATHILLTLGLFLLLRVWFSPGISLLTAALTSFLSAAPQRFVLGGGNATVLSLAFILAALSLFFSLRRRHTFLEILAQSSFWAAGFLCHSVVFLGVAYFLVAFALGFLLVALVRRRLSALRVHAVQCVWVFVIALLLVFPFWEGFSADVSDNEIKWNRMWQTEAPFGYYGNITDSYWTIPVYIGIGGGYHFLGLAFIGLLISTLNWRFKSSIALSSLVVCALILNSAYRVLPFSHALYPERMLVLLFAPMSMLVAGLVDRMRQLAVWAASRLKQFRSMLIVQGQSRTVTGLCAGLIMTAAPLCLAPALLASRPGKLRSILGYTLLAVLTILLLQLWSLRQERKLSLAVIGLSAVIVAASLASGHCFATYNEHYLEPFTARPIVTAHDVQAFEWIQENTHESDIFLNLGHDDMSSLWIPAICARRILQPHWCPLYLDELITGNQGTTPKYLFIGSHASSSRNSDEYWLRRARRSSYWEELAVFGQSAIFQLQPFEGESNWRQMIKGTDSPLLPSQ